MLDAACTLRRPTLSLLGALLPGVPPHDAYEMLRPLPFVEFGPDGLVLHDTVREVVAALLRVNDPPAYRAHSIAVWRHADGGEVTTPAHASLILDLKRPRLRRLYSLAADPAAALSRFTPLGFARLPDGAAEIGGTTYHALCNDFGPSSIYGWLTDLAAREMLIDNHALLDPDRRQLILDGTRARPSSGTPSGQLAHDRTASAAPGRPIPKRAAAVLARFSWK